MLSVNQETFVPHEIKPNKELKELANDLRAHHFSIGNDQGDNMVSMHNTDFREKPSASRASMDMKLRDSHFKVADGSAAPDHYTSSYNKSHDYKGNSKAEKAPNANFKSSGVLGTNEKFNFASEAQANFGAKYNQLSQGDINTIQNVIKDIKSTHFNLGNDGANFSTTNNAAFGFDAGRAANAKSTLNTNLLNDLRASHYKIGYGPSTMSTTHMDTYRPKDISPANAFKNLSEDLRRSHFNVENKQSNNSDLKKTVYMSDYYSKPLPEAY